jgi:hypothetical protein
MIATGKRSAARGIRQTETSAPKWATLRSKPITRSLTEMIQKPGPSVAHFGARILYDIFPQAALRLLVARISGPFRAMEMPDKLCHAYFSGSVVSRHHAPRLALIARLAVAGGGLVLEAPHDNLTSVRLWEIMTLRNRTSFEHTRSLGVSEPMPAQ